MGGSRFGREQGFQLRAHAEVDVNDPIEDDRLRSDAVVIAVDRQREERIIEEGGDTLSVHDSAFIDIDAEGNGAILGDIERTLRDGRIDR